MDGQCMGNVWVMYGNVRAIYVQCKGNVQAIYKQCMGNVWEMYG